MQLMKQKRRELEADVRRERATRRRMGAAVRADREEQVKLAKEKQELSKKLRRVVEEEEKQLVVQSLREERERLAKEKRRAQEDMESVLLENQKSLEQKRAEAQKEKEETMRCMEEYSRMLLHQEQERERQLERIHEIQRAQEQAPALDLVAAGTKAWVDDAVVAEQAAQRELTARQKEEDVRKAAQRRNEETLKTLGRQVEEKLEKRAAELRVKHADKSRLAAMDRESKENHKAAMQKAADKCLALKRGLDVQIAQQRKAIRASVGMNRLERALNAHVLRQARSSKNI